MCVCVCVCVCVHALSCFSPVQLGGTLWMVALQNPLSMGFSRQEYWSELPRPPPGDLPDSGIEPTSLTSPALAGRFFTISTTWEAPSVPDILLNLETYALDYMPILRKFCPFNCITQCRIYRFCSTSKKQKTCVWHIISDVRYKV